MRARTLLCALTVAAVGWLAATTRASAREIGPEEPLCPAINALQPGEELVLRPGEDQGACTIFQGGRPGEPITLRGVDGDGRPRIVYTGSTANVLDVKAGHVRIPAAPLDQPPATLTASAPSLGLP